MLLFCCTVGCFFSFPAVAGIIKHIKYRAGEAQIILTAEGKSRGKNIVPVLRFPFSPKSSSRSLSFFPSPANVNLRDWDNFSCPPTSTPTSRRQNPALFYSPLKEHLEEMRAPPLTVSPLLRCCVIYFFFFPFPASHNLPSIKKKK